MAKIYDEFTGNTFPLHNRKTYVYIFFKLYLMLLRYFTDLQFIIKVWKNKNITLEKSNSFNIGRII